MKLRAFVITRTKYNGRNYTRNKIAVDFQPNKPQEEAEKEIFAQYGVWDDRKKGQDFCTIFGFTTIDETKINERPEFEPVSTTIECPLFDPIALKATVSYGPNYRPKREKRIA